MFLNKYNKKRVLVTGHTGFKGAWLSQWLLRLGAEVSGYSLYIPSEPSGYDVLGLSKKIKDYRGDVRDIKKISQVFKEVQPEIVFHLAAQPIVRISYDDPKLTFDTNLGGTVNILEIIRKTSSVRSAVFITSDKCYENVEWEHGYRENDMLGGKDPYSASKACAETAFRAYFNSFFAINEQVMLSTARAGNVIGGADWAQDRIVPDCVRAWAASESVVIRNPKATRPWQHVLEPLSGYLWLGAKLLDRGSGLNGEAFNFGPPSDVTQSVIELIDEMKKVWPSCTWQLHKEANSTAKEASLLKLSCDKALQRLKWKPTLSFNESVSMTGNWYKKYYQRDDHDNMYDFTVHQIDEYVKLAQERGIAWAKL